MVGHYLGMGFFKRIRARCIWFRVSRKYFKRLIADYANSDSLRSSGYSICPSFGHPGERFFFSFAPSIYWDTHMGLILKHNGLAVACIGFEGDGNDIEGKSGDRVSLSVLQIQGVRGREYLLKGLRWERLLLRIVIETAKELGFSEVRVQPGDKNSWANDGNKERFKLRYDVTARREGFRKNEDWFVLNLAG